MGVRIKSIAVGWLAVSTVALPTIGHAQRQQAETGPPVVVTGTRETAATLRERTAAFVRQTGVVTAQQAAARWIVPVCPRALGLAAALSARVEQVVRTVARDAGVRVATEPCKANIVISFVGDGAATMRTVARRQPRRLAEVAHHDRAALVDGTAPVRWWYTTKVTGSDGRSTTADPPAFLMASAEGGGSALPNDGRQQYLSLYRSSIVSTQVVRALSSASVVVDVNRAEGVTLDAVGAYAAMVALAEIRPDATPERSILGLFAGQTKRPNALTSTDEAFLRALYRIPLDRTGLQQRGMLVNTMLAPAPEQ